MPRFATDGTNAVAPIALQVGEKVRLDSDRRWWTVRAVTTNFAALTRQEDFAPADTRRYTVLDWRNGVRGPCNLVGQGYGDGTYTETECAQLLAEFEAGELEISHRNWVRLRIVDVIPLDRVR